MIKLNSFLSGYKTEAEARFCDTFELAYLRAVHDETDAVQGVPGGGDDREPPFFSVEVVEFSGVEVVYFVAVSDGDALPDNVLGLKRKRPAIFSTGILVDKESTEAGIIKAARS